MQLEPTTSMRRRVLLVEPPGLRRSDARQRLRGSGYQVDEAPDEAAALRLLAQRGQRYAVVMTDERPDGGACARVAAVAQGVRAELLVLSLDARVPPAAPRVPCAQR